MATDYREVLKELRAEENRLSSELEIVRGMIPGAELMAGRMQNIVMGGTLGQHPPSSIFAGMGPRMAILALLAVADRPLMPSEITRILIEGGIQTRSSDLGGTIGSTLTQLKGHGLVERKDDGWVAVRRDNVPMTMDVKASLRDAIEQTLPSSQ